MSRGYIYKLLGNPLYIGRIPHKGASYEGQHPAIIDAETWEAVQARLASGAQERRSGTRAAEPSLLAGMLYDDRGNRLSPSHTTKKGVRYRYYVSQALLQQRNDDAGPVMRIPAHEIEELFTVRFGRFLSNAREVMDELGGSLPATHQRRLVPAARKLAERWRRLKTSERRALLISVSISVTAGEGKVVIGLGRDALRCLLLDAPAIHQATCANSDTSMHEVDDRLLLTVSARLKRCTGAMRLVIPPTDAERMPARPNASLINAVVRAYKWKEKLFSNEAVSVRAIAYEEGMTERPVARILRLAFLSPKLTEAILDGRQPADLELKGLLRGLPLNWEEQHQLVGVDRPD